MINIVDLFGLNEQSQIATIEMVLSYIWRLALAEQLEEMGNIYIFIDEVQNISLSSKGMLSMLLSEGRKYKLNLILATQLLNYSSLNPTQRKLLQAGLILYFMPADCDRSATAAMISENDKDSWAMELATLEVGEFIATGPLVVGDIETKGPILVDGRIMETPIDQSEDERARSVRNRHQVIVVKRKQ